jgi:AAA domain
MLRMRTLRILRPGLPLGCRRTSLRSCANSSPSKLGPDRDIPAPDRLLGDLLTTTSRMFLVGRTGLGKTMLGMGMACGMATGRGFLHWRRTRPARVLYIDGEMPAELVKARSIDVLRRAGIPPHPDNLLIFVRDTMEEFAARYPSLGQFAPLNSEEGQNFVHALIRAVGGVDVVIFDNVMSLVAGDQKGEVPWSETLPLVSALTAKRVGQVWLDHNGHSTDRQYGSATKAWRFDAVGLMKPLPDDQRNPREVAFILSFERPARRADAHRIIGRTLKPAPSVCARINGPPNQLNAAPDSRSLPRAERCSMMPCWTPSPREIRWAPGKCRAEHGNPSASDAT